MRRSRPAPSRRSSYDSAVAGEERQALVWVPPTYTPKGKKLPVLYLQHGGGQSYRDWVEVGRAEQILDNLWLPGQLEDMLVVMGNGNVDDFSAELLENIVPAVERTLQRLALEEPSGAGRPVDGWRARRSRCFSEHPGEFDVDRHLRSRTLRRPRRHPRRQR